MNYEIVTRIGHRVPRSYRAVLSESGEPAR
ncbi:hypothetical protein QN345_11440 [Cryobacterium sp. 10I1]|nr:hypothetical protein [Cryobacterium sp. 10I1]MEB0305918.1 hypothetical protein [Cryobacterium sp. 10I1]